MFATLSYANFTSRVVCIISKWTLYRHFTFVSSARLKFTNHFLPILSLIASLFIHFGSIFLLQLQCTWCIKSLIFIYYIYMFHAAWACWVYFQPFHYTLLMENVKTFFYSWYIFSINKCFLTDNTQALYCVIYLIFRFRIQYNYW